MRHYIKTAVRTIFFSVWILMFPFLSESRQANAQQPKKSKSVRQAKMPAPNVRFATGNSALKIPFELDGNIILLRVSVNNSKPLKFIFDTAASVTVINPKRAAELGLKMQEQVQGKATGGAIQASLIRGVSLSVPGATVSNQLIAAVSFGEFPCYEIDGILGNNFTDKFVVEIDYQNKFLNLYSPKTYAYAGKGAVIPISFAGGRVSVSRAKIFVGTRNSIEGNFEVDTGADGTLVVYSPFVEKHKLLEAMPQTVQSKGVGAGGEEEIFIGRVEGVELGKLVIDNPTIGLSRNTEGEKYDGIIGGEILRRFKVIFDYSRKRMILEPNSSFSNPYEVDMSGISLEIDEDDCKTLRVGQVAENSPASEAGLQVGDIITAIDGKSASNFSPTELDQIFKQNGKEFSLSIKRGGDTAERKIKLRRII